MTIKHVYQSLLLSLGLSASLLSHAELKPVDSIAAIVDDSIILHSEINSRVKTVKNQSRGMQLPPDSVLKTQVLDRLITESIQLQIAERAGMRVSDQELNQTIESIARQNKMSLPQFKKALEKDGIPFLDAREQIRRERLITEVQRYRVGNTIQISEQDVDAFLNSIRGKAATAEEYRLLHILVQVPGQASSADVKKAKAKAQSIVKELRAGADFRQTAVAKSDGRNALKGGDLGWRKEGELPTLFAEVVPTLPLGGISSPIKSASGFHIIKIDEKRGGTTKLVKQTRVRHILLQANEIRDEIATQKLINELYQRLKKGEDFAKLAKEFSDDPGSKVAGGDLNWVSQGDMVPAFDEVMLASKKDVISKPFKSRFGWHVLQVTGHREKDMGNEIQRSQARQLLYSRRFEEELPIWLRQVRAEAYVEIK